MEAVANHYHHKYKVCKVYRQKIFPFKTKQLVYTQTWESPFEPNYYKRQGHGLKYKPKG